MSASSKNKTPLNRYHYDAADLVFTSMEQIRPVLGCAIKLKPAFVKAIQQPVDNPPTTGIVVKPVAVKVLKSEKRG